MSLRVNGFATVQPAALCAARVGVSAAVCGSEETSGARDPLRLPQIAVQDPPRRGSLRLGTRASVVRHYSAPSLTFIAALPLACSTLTHRSWPLNPGM